jgi:hypothetical protein
MPADYRVFASEALAAAEAESVRKSKVIGYHE